MVLELGFYVGAYQAAGKRAVCHVVDDRNRLLQDGFSNCPAGILRILKQGRLEADDGRLG